MSVKLLSNRKSRGETSGLNPLEEKARIGNHRASKIELPLRVREDLVAYQRRLSAGDDVVIHLDDPSYYPEAGEAERRYRDRKKECVQAGIVEALSDVAASRQYQARFRLRYRG